MSRRPRPSAARVFVTPIILIVAGYLVAGLVGAGVAAVLGLGYIMWASR